MNKDQVYLAKKYRQHGIEQRRYTLSGLWFDPWLQRYVKNYRGKRSRYIKKMCNKRFRKQQHDGSQQRGYHRKATEF